MKVCTSMIMGLMLATTLLGCATHSSSDSVADKETRGLPGTIHPAHETNTPTSQPPGSGLTSPN
jgi:hypothetical protein